MLLPFVREIFAEVEQLPAFTRAASHLRESAGRISVTGLSAAAKALIVVLLRRTVERPFVLVVADNRAAEELLPVLRAFCELTGAADPDSVVSLPARDVLPFQNLSPHPEIQEERATALWKIATGRAAIVISPVTATTILLRSPDYYADLARVLRRGEIFDLEKLLEHLNTVGYSATDVVEMPGQYAARGGILDVYSPEADRPVRVEFFGDEIESMRKFDPASQRSSNPVDEALLLPLTETPVTEELLGSINARLSGKRITGSPEAVEQAVRDSGAGIFPGWEFYAPVAGADRSIFGLLPEARVILDEPEALQQELDKVWARIEEAHERSGVGNLVRPADLYLTPESWRETTAALPGADFEYLAVARGAPEAPEKTGSRFSFTARHPLPRRGARHDRAGSEAGRRRHAGDSCRAQHRRSRAPRRHVHRVQRFVSSGKPHAQRRKLCRRNFLFCRRRSHHYAAEGLFARRLCFAGSASRDFWGARSVRRIGPGGGAAATAEIESLGVSFRLPRFAGRRLRGSRGARHRAVSRSEGNQPGRRRRGIHAARVCRGARLYVPLTRLDLVQKYRSAEGAKPVS
jgi:transcription-repair coupling factor (superfamily II helicase)